MKKGSHRVYPLSLLQTTRRIQKKCIKTALLILLLSGNRVFAQTSETASPFPDNLVLDVRLFETRSANPDREAMHELNFFIATDGRGVTANQWLATTANKVPDAFIAALAFETARVKQDGAHLRWARRSRLLEMDIRIRDYHPAGSFKAEVETRFSRVDQMLRQFQKEVELQRGRTTVWSAEDLEVPLRDYLSHFREYQDREHRGLLYEKLRDRSVFLVVSITPRLLSEDELPQLVPEKLALPPGTELPEFDNPLGAPLHGTIVVGFEIDPEGTPLNPQIVLSSLPEVNPRILGEVSRWSFAAAAPDENRRRWGRVEVRVEIP